LAALTHPWFYFDLFFVHEGERDVLRRNTHILALVHFVAVFTQEAHELVSDLAFESVSVHSLDESLLEVLGLTLHLLVLLSYFALYPLHLWL
jgi:hypothetical protein